MRPVLLALAIFVSPVIVVQADDSPANVTWAADVASVVFENCTGCHRPGQMGPMELTSYEQARPWAKSIRTVVVNRDMPPWDANPDHGDFANDISLSEAEINLISKWVDLGAPFGDQSQTPPLPEFTEGWLSGEPDYVIEFEAVDIPAGGPDLFPNLVVDVELPEEKWVRAVEVRPGDSRVLHHIVARKGSAMGGAFSSMGGGPLAVWAAGTPPIRYPDKVGIPVAKRFRVTANMHYHPIDEPTVDKTRIGLYFGEGELDKVVVPAVAGNLDVRIPPGDATFELEAEYKFHDEVDIISFFPHMHMRGRQMVYTAHYPDGREEILLDVPRYDFDWQWFYYPKQPIRMPAGTRLHIVGRYDNSAANDNNPNPEAWVYFGEESDDDMMFGMFETIAVEGKMPTFPSRELVMAEKLAELPELETWRAQVKAGFVQMPVLMHLPSEGRGTMYVPFGGQMLGLPFGEMHWKDDGAFETTLELFGQRSRGYITGQANPDGSLAGDFDLKGMEEFGGMPLVLQGFTGTRADKLPAPE